MYTQSPWYTKQSPQSPKYTEWSLGVYKKYQKVSDAYAIRTSLHVRSVITPASFLCRKNPQTCFPVPAPFYILLPIGIQLSLYQRRKIHCETDGSAVTRALERVHQLCNFLSVNTSCVKMWYLVFFIKSKTSSVVKETSLSKKNPAINDVVKVIYGNSKSHAARIVCKSSKYHIPLFNFLLSVLFVFHSNRINNL